MDKPKTCDKMNFQEFRQWAKEVIMREFLKNGLDGLDDALFTILNQVTFNEVFGGAKKIKKTK